LLNTTTDPSTVNAIELKENGCADCVSPTPTPTLTPTPTSSVSYTNWGAKGCCEGVPLIIVQVLTNDQPTTSLEGFVYNGECYFFVGTGGSNPVTTILPEDYNNDPCNNPSCPSCPSPTPTPSPLPPPTVPVGVSATPTPTITPTITVTPSITPTPSPSVYDCLVGCRKYGIYNYSAILTLTVEYTDCYTGVLETLVVKVNDSEIVCACGAPTRVSGSTNYDINDEGICR